MQTIVRSENLQSWAKRGKKMQTCAKRGKNNTTSGAKRGKIRLSEVVTIGCGYVWFWLVEGNEITVLFD